MSPSERVIAPRSARVLLASLPGPRLTRNAVKLRAQLDPAQFVLEPWPAADAIAFDHGGGLLATVSAASGVMNLAIWDVAKRERRDSSALDGVRAATCIALAPAGDQVAIGALSGDVQIHDREGWQTPKHRYTNFHSPIQSIVYDPTGTWLAVSDDSGSVMLAAANTGQVIALERVDSEGVTLAFDVSGRQLLIVRKRDIAVMVVDPAAWAITARALAGSVFVEQIDGGRSHTEILPSTR